MSERRFDRMAQNAMPGFRSLISRHDDFHPSDSFDFSVALVDPSSPFGRAAQSRLQGCGFDVVIGIEGFDATAENVFFLVPSHSLAFQRIRARLRSWRKKLPLARSLLLTADAAPGQHRPLRPRQGVPSALTQALAQSNILWSLPRSDLATYPALSQIGTR